jgi:hypothetical protein
MKFVISSRNVSGMHLVGLLEVYKVTPESDTSIFHNYE